jgi:hypothetical protein
MQTHQKEGGPDTGSITPETYLEEGSDFQKKEGGLRVLTTDGVRKMAEALRLRRPAAVQRLAVEVPDDIPEPPEDAPEWQPGPAAEVPVEELDDDIAIYATARRHHFNRRLLGCEIEGKAGMINVAVRDSAFYRAGEKFAVQLNDTGSWEAAHHRTVARRP